MSIVVPVYNREGLVGETLDSILGQTFPNWECIIVDDHSDDSTFEVINEYQSKDSRFKIFKRPADRPKGANSCRNYGFEQSTGAYVNWFDSDDIMLPEKLEIQLSSLTKSEYAFSVCQTLVFEEEKENIIGLRKESIHSEDFFNDFVTNKIMWLTQAPLIERSFIDQYEFRFDETLAKGQERDFFINLLSVVNGYHHTDQPLVLFRKHPNSISNKPSTPQKLYSSFLVNFNIIKRHSSRLNKESIRYLKRVLLSKLYQLNRMDERSLVGDILNQIKSIKVYNPLELLVIKLKLLYFANRNSSK
ncbi:glycosyltransferase family 2 protein [Aureitalea marina]|uniref:glycosyltransferase family 2 protein n=1 Tax=Aureitalea marina TaxID=930804 RepID=UPI0015E2D1C3|nr:glycosyltransferase [Aureitalea marina]